MPLQNKPSSATQNVLAAVFKKEHVILLFILAVTCFVFWPSLFHGFSNWDDKTHLLENHSVLSLDKEGVVSIFQGVVNKTYIPLTILSFAVEHYFFGFNPFVYHLNNLLLHLGITALVFFLGLRMGLSRRGAGAAALLFGIHPMHVESVVWVTERKDVLYAFFYMLASYGYWRYLQTRSTKAYVLSILSGWLSILAKAMALSLPLVLFLFDRFHGNRLSRKSFFDKIPFFLYTFPIAWITYALHTRVPGENVYHAPLIWIWSFSFYIRKFFFPVDLSPLYQLPQPVSLTNPVYAASVLVFILMGMLVWLWRKDRWFVFAVGYYVLSIFFLLRFDAVDGSIVADRFMYLPSLGICLWLGWVYANSVEKFGAGIRFVLMIAVMCLGLVLAKQTYQQCQVWKTPVDLWTHAISKSPDNDFAYNNRSDAYITLGKYDLALADLTKALSIPPHHAEELYNRGVLHAKLGHADLALKDFDQALKINPYYVKAYNNRGFLLFEKKDVEGAILNFTKAVEIEPSYAGAYCNRGMVYESLWRQDLAMADYSQAIVVSPNYVQAYVQRSKLHLLRGDHQKALEDAVKARTLGVSNFDNYINQLKSYVTSP